MSKAEWEQRIEEAWASFDDRSEAEFVALMETLTDGGPTECSAAARFEMAGAYDSTGQPDRAVPLYREALELGLDDYRRRRAVIQLASSLRNLGKVHESIALLTSELDVEFDQLEDELRGFLALALVDVGRDREAVSHTLTALAPHLTRYQRSLTNYAAQLLVERPTRSSNLPTSQV